MSGLPDAPERSVSLRREQLNGIRLRHRGYRILLLTISLVLLLQPAAQQWPLLNPLGAITLSLVMMLFLTRYSPLLAMHLAIAHLLIWALFIGIFMLRKAKALMVEPYVTQAVVMGAAAGYLLIGYLGAFLLHTLLLWHPAAFDVIQLPAGVNPAQSPLQAFPTMVLASFGALTTTGSSIGRSGEVLASTGCMAITIVGQLYVAVLIALILGRFHRRGGP